MICAGLDIGSRSAKAVLVEHDTILSWNVIPVRPDVEGVAHQVLEGALESARRGRGEVEALCSTGYGRVVVPFADRNITEISAHARGTHWSFPAVRTILDMGGQDCKAIRCDAQGLVTHFLFNERCAAGTGRFLERIAEYLEMPVQEIGPRSLEVVEGPVKIDSYCAVFAQRDIMRLIRKGAHPNDILAGASQALVRRITSLLDRLGVEPELSITGGIAYNEGIVQRIEQHFGLKARLAPNPQIIGALGAALFARDLVGGGNSHRSDSLAPLAPVLPSPEEVVEQRQRISSRPSWRGSSGG